MSVVEVLAGICQDARPPLHDATTGSYQHSGHVERVVDGDTVDVILHASIARVGVVVWEERLRLAYIDTPELRSGTPEQRAAGRAARDRTLELAPTGAECTVHLHDVDAFGRGIASLIVAATDVGETLLREGHAVPYVKR